MRQEYILGQTIGKKWSSSIQTCMVDWTIKKDRDASDTVWSWLTECVLAGLRFSNLIKCVNISRTKFRCAQLI